eukprot:6503051-Pyramimonas_sp.AAC.2
MQHGLPGALRCNLNLIPPERTALHIYAHGTWRRRRGKGRGGAKGWVLLRRGQARGRAGA